MVRFTAFKENLPRVVFLNVLLRCHVELDSEPLGVQHLPLVEKEPPAECFLGKKPAVVAMGHEVGFEVGSWTSLRVTLVWS